MTSFSVGLLGHGTVGSAFHELLDERADAIEAATGRRPEIAGVLTRLAGDFDDILERSDLIVELIGGIEPAREYILRALRAGKHVVTANKQVLSQHGEEIYEAAREGGVQLRFEAAVGGVVPVIRVIHETLAGAHVERVHGIVNGTTNFILTEMTRTGATYEEALARGAGARLRGGRPDRGRHRQGRRGEDGDHRAAGVQRAGHARRRAATRGSRTSRPTTSRTRRSSGCRSSCRHRRARDGGISVRVHPAFLYGEHPLASVERRRSTRSRSSRRRSPRSRCRARAPAVADRVRRAGRRDLGDDPAARRCPRRPRTSRSCTDVESAFYLHVEVADRPGVLAQIAEILGLQGVSVKSVVQHGLGDDARLEIVVHPVLESKFLAAVELIGRLDFLRAKPRVIRVIDELR